MVLGIGYGAGSEEVAMVRVVRKKGGRGRVLEIRHGWLKKKVLLRYGLERPVIIRIEIILMGFL